MKAKKVIVKPFFILIIVAFASCVIDSKNTYYIKNLTSDTLLINLSGADSLEDWIYWSEMDTDAVPLDYHNENVVFCRAIIGSIAYPDSFIYVDPYDVKTHNPCYIYAVKLSVAKRYSVEEIREKKLYYRRIVTQNDFKDRMYEYRP